MIAAEQNRPDVAARRHNFSIARRFVPPQSLVFLDESGAQSNMTRLYGRAPGGERCVDHTPHGHWKTTTLICALDHCGMRCATHVDGAVNGDIFTAFIQQVLAPALKPGEMVIMDNLSAHKVAGVREAIEAAGATVLYLPPYSPDLNPIELAFSKLKQLLRSARHRTVDPLWRDTQRILDGITPTDAIHFFQHCGYTLQGK